jgi:chaperone modulatory protein CbpM
MIELDEVLRRCRVERIELEAWIERSWVLPARGDGSYIFSETDVARVALICDLTRDLEIGEEAIGVILPLIDQVYSLRASLRRVADVVGQLPEPIRAQIRDELNKPPKG